MDNKRKAFSDMKTETDWTIMAHPGEIKFYGFNSVALAFNLICEQLNA